MTKKRNFATATLLWLALFACGQENAETGNEAAAVATPAAEDPYLWLEEVDGEEALAWVEEHNEKSLSYLKSLPTYEPLKARNLEIMNSDERIAAPGIRGDYVYNYWRDAENVRGLWRRTTIEDYVGGDPSWDTILDLDALAASEGEDWVWKGSSCLRPEYRHCVLSLSRGGADAVVIREFDIEERRFVEDGFYVAEAKTGFGWVDKDSAYIGTDFGDGSLTDSGYPRTSRLWKRGTPLSEAKEVFAGEKTDVSASIYRGWDGDDHYDIASRSTSFYTRERFLKDSNGELIRLDIPADAKFSGIVRGQMLVELKSDWEPAEQKFSQGSLISITFDKFLQGDRDFDVVFEPAGSRVFGGGITVTRDFVIVSVLDNVLRKMVRYSFEDGQWTGTEIETDDTGTASLVSAAEDSNTFFFSFTNQLTPSTLFITEDGGQSVTRLKSQPGFFDTEGMVVEQYFATSADGTQVPYFIMLPANFEANGKTPTVINGYGGFQVALTPRYSAITGHSWVARGGAYVVANIRGGGEFGPAWHQAALKENRQRAYDDFIAIAEDLIDRGITSPQHLGIRGGSNGGLLTGVMLTQRPDLWNAVLVQVPLLDMKRFNRLLAGASWMGEYGDPDTSDWEFIKKYSPYHNIRKDVQYPKAFITTSTRDDRVHPGHARKMVARMREMGHDLLYYENTVGGHAGASDNSQAASNHALVHSYFWDQLGGDGESQ